MSVSIIIPSYLGHLKYLNRFRKRLHLILGQKSKKLNAEGNKYFHDKKRVRFSKVIS